VDRAEARQVAALLAEEYPRGSGPSGSKWIDFAVCPAIALEISMVAIIFK